MRWVKIHKILAAIFVVVLAGCTCLSVTYLHSRTACKRSNIDFQRRIDALQLELTKNILRGTTKKDVERFLSDHHFSVIFNRNQAIGTMSSSGGCAPFGCGTNEILLGVTIRLDSNGSVAEVPQIQTMFTDCM